jgi:putative transposase
MNNGYSVDLRERVVGYIEQGGSKTEAAKLFKVSRKTIYNWLSRKAKNGSLLPNKLKKYKVRKLDDTKVLEQIEATPDATLAEMGEVFKVSRSAMWYALQRLKITRKKNASLSGTSGRSPRKVLPGT